jgi:hypothetical protein
MTSRKCLTTFHSSYEEHYRILHSIPLTLGTTHRYDTSLEPVCTVGMTLYGTSTDTGVCFRDQSTCPQYDTVSYSIISKVESNEPSIGIIIILRTSSSTMAMLSSAGMHSSLRWATFGWAFFIAENAILSENRSYIIEQLGDANYHYVYGTFSTAATASIGYGYYKLRNTIIPPNFIIWKNKPPFPSAVGAWVFMTVGIFLASQTLPKFQIPIAIVDSNPAGVSAPAQPSTGKKLQVRCPFDFTGRKNAENAQIYGTERISRYVCVVIY